MRQLEEKDGLQSNQLKNAEQELLLRSQVLKYKNEQKIYKNEQKNNLNIYF